MTLTIAEGASAHNIEVFNGNPGVRLYGRMSDSWVQAGVNMFGSAVAANIRCASIGGSDPDSSVSIFDVDTNGISFGGGANHYVQGVTRTVILRDTTGVIVKAAIKPGTQTSGQAVEVTRTEDSHVEVTFQGGLRRDGVVVTDSSRIRLIVDAMFDAAIADNTKDAIRIQSDADVSDAIDLRGTRINPVTGGNALRYGVNIADSDVSAVVMVDVNFGPGANYGTAPFVDNGTNTVTTYTGGGSGDNIVL